MDPQRKEAPINSLVDDLLSYEDQRPALHGLHLQKLQGMAASLPENDDLQILGQMMVNTFLRHYDELDSMLMSPKEYKFCEDSVAVRNFATVLSDSFSPFLMLEVLRSYEEKFPDDVDFKCSQLTSALRFGFMECVKTYADQLIALGHNKEFSKYYSDVSSKFIGLGVTDDGVAEYLAAAFAPLRSYMKGRYNLVVDSQTQYLFEEHSNLIAVNYNLNASDDDAYEISEASLDAVSKTVFPDPINSHLVLSVNAKG